MAALSDCNSPDIIARGFLENEIGKLKLWVSHPLVVPFIFIHCTIKPFDLIIQSFYSIIYL